MLAGKSESNLRRTNSTVDPPSFAAALVDRIDELQGSEHAGGDIAEARLDLEKSLGAKVFLDLRVKVKADWRDDERVLDDLGLPRRQ